MTTSSSGSNERPPADARRPAVVVPFAFKPRCRDAVREALGQVDFASELTVVHVMGEGSSEREVDETRHRLIEELHAIGCPDAQLQIIRGSAAGPALAAWIAEHEPAMIVMPRSKRGLLRRTVFGSVVEPIVRAGTTRVLVLPERA